MAKQFHLNAKNCSGRGVRVRILSPEQCDRVLSTAAKQVGPDASMIDLRLLAAADGVKAMITEVTKETNLKDLASATWVPVSLAQLEDERKGYSSLFNAKDDKLLKEIYRQLHEVGPDEVEDIVGKGLDLAD